METAGDEDLIRAVKAGRDEALPVLVERHGSRLAAWFARRLGSREDAEEATQDVFLRDDRGAATFREGAGFLPWFRAIARNVLTDRLRRAPRSKTVALSVDPPADLTLYRDPPAVAEVRDAIAALAQEDRAALTFKFLAGLSYREAAAELGLTERGFETRLRRAKERLREELLRRRSHGLR
jgi:RNA polymerase sigma-70 factor (ECF subfamily)